VLLGRSMTTDHAGFEEPELDSCRKAPPVHLPPGQRVDLELKAVRGSLVGALHLAHVGRLVVHDDGALVTLVDAVPSTPDANGTQGIRQGHAELALDRGGTGARCLLLVPEATDRSPSSLPARLLVGLGKESLVAPLVVISREQVFERGVDACGAPPQ